MLNPQELIKNNIWIVMPCFNEQDTLHDTIQAVLTEGYTHIIVVDDHSSQNMFSAIADLPVVFIRHSINLGQGAALQTGFEYAKLQHADIVVSFDADGQHSPSDIIHLVNPILEEGFDVVLGSRFLLQSSPSISFSRKMVLQAGRYVNFLFTGILLSDAHNGMRALNKKALQKIDITEGRMAHASEILFQLKQHRLQFKEVPVRVYYSAQSRRKGQSSIDGIKIFFDLILHKLFK
jgi:glycosyltransferase involved in cell wall biosynthesis